MTEFAWKRSSNQQQEDDEDQAIRSWISHLTYLTTSYSQHHREILEYQQQKDPQHGISGDPHACQVAWDWYKISSSDYDKT